MRINPKTFTLCELERAVILNGLSKQRHGVKETIARLKAKETPNLPLIDVKEMQLARIEDLMKRMKP